MRKLVGAAIVLLVMCKPGHAAPQHIMSLTICTDELLMDLVPPSSNGKSRIASISYLSREKAALRLWPEALRLPVNHNSAEEVLAQKPDLVLTLAYASTPLRPMLEKSGIRFLEISEPENFDQIRAVTRQAADAIGARPRAEALIAGMDEKLRRLAAAAPHGAIKVADWGGSGALPGKGSLFDSVLRAAGGTNIAHGGYYDVESLIAARPDVLAMGDEYAGLPSLRSGQNSHPLLLKLFAGRRVNFPGALYRCGLPETADAAVALHAALTDAMRHPGGVP